MALAGFEPTIPASERQQTHALGRAACGIAAVYLRHFAILLDVFCRVKKSALCGHQVRPSVTWCQLICLSDSNEIKDRSSLQKAIGEGGRFREQRPNWS